MSFSGNPGETYCVSELLATAFGILRAVGIGSSNKPPCFDESLEQLETCAESLMELDMEYSDRQLDEDLDVIEYTQIIDQINAIQRNWLRGRRYEQ